MDFDFVVPGPPRPLGRPRTTVTPTGKLRTYTPKESHKYENIVRWAAIAARPRTWSIEGAFALSVRAFWPDAKKRDLDNLVKGVSDAIIGVAFKDDVQVTELHAWAEIDGARPRVEVSVRSLSNESARSGP